MSTPALDLRPLSPDKLAHWVEERCITQDILTALSVAETTFGRQEWIAFPVPDAQGKPLFYKLKRPHTASEDQPKYLVHPKGSKATLYPQPYLHDRTESVVLCEGEPDALVLLSHEIDAVCSTGGAGTFKEEWLSFFPEGIEVTLCFDLDEAGRKGTEKVLRLFRQKRPDIRLSVIRLPEDLGEGGDVTDFFRSCKKKGKDSVASFFALRVPSGTDVSHSPVDLSRFKPMTPADVSRILGQTIKKDEANKFVTFLCQLSAFTDNAQFNISFNAPSSTGKSYIPTEIAALFPQADVMEIGYCSPQAFFHDYAKFNEERKAYEIDLSRKIIIFMDQPHTQLLERLRPLLSHDKKEIHVKITDKSKGGANRTKNIYIRGFPSVVFCTAGLRMDEQESTRFLLLSPETNQEKIRAAIIERIRKETDSAAYYAALNADPERGLLMERIVALRDCRITDVRIGNAEKIKAEFLGKRKFLKPRHQRDIGRLLSLIKSLALLNFPYRVREGDVIQASPEDIDEAVKLWESMSESQEYNLPPYVFDLLRDVIIPAYNDLPKDGLIPLAGVTYKDILKRHNEVYGRMIAPWLLRQEVLPLLETAGLIELEKDPNDRRKVLIIPLLSLTTSDSEEIASGDGDMEDEEILSAAVDTGGKMPKGTEEPLQASFLIPSSKSPQEEAAEDDGGGGGDISPTSKTLKDFGFFQKQ